MEKSNSESNTDTTNKLSSSSTANPLTADLDVPTSPTNTSDGGERNSVTIDGDELGEEVVHDIYLMLHVTITLVLFTSSLFIAIVFGDLRIILALTGM